MARKRYRNLKLQQAQETPALFDLDAEARLWLARGTLHQFLSDRSEEELPGALSRTLSVELPEEIEEDGRILKRRRMPRPTRRALTIAALEERIDALQRQCNRKVGRLSRSARRITKIFGLGDLYARVLAWFAACELHDEYAALSRVGDLDTHRQRLLLASSALNLPCRTLEPVLGRKGALLQHGLVIFDENGSTCSFSLPRKLRALFGVERPTEDHVLSSLLATGPAPRFSLADFAYVRELPLLSHLLAGALESKAGPVHVLLHGAPGTGKSELARALATAAGARLCEVPTEDDDGDALHAAGRASELRLLDGVAGAQRDRYCILVDEADDLLPRRERTLFGGFMSGSVGGKGFYNELLETTRTPILWTSNTPENLDEAHLRRFSLIVELRAPARAQRHAIADRRAGEARIEPGLLREVADDERLPLALLETIGNTMTLTRASTGTAATASLPPGPDERSVVQQVARGFLAVSGKAPPSKARPTRITYDPSLMNASLDLSAVSARMQERPHATVLLSGPPGTGKSAWARALADSLSRPLLVRTPSDLLSMYVGGTEQNLARAFAAAEADGAVLLLDEADTYLFPRAEAVRSWEISQTNEMLVRVESFDGILVATTNSDRLDEAILRRFDLKVELRPLKLEQRTRLLAALCEAVGVPPPGEEEAARLAALDKLCAGDFVAVERRLGFCEPSSAAEVLAALEEEHAHKKGAARGKIGFGG
ncbi:MAG: ATP-binding protein [Deltaproteobacteria bacterium]|nr:ATP-binding protein [Deltaproteobacteria bacterium]